MGFWKLSPSLQLFLSGKSCWQGDQSAVGQNLEEMDYLIPFLSGFRLGFNNETALVIDVDDMVELGWSWCFHPLCSWYFSGYQHCQPQYPSKSVPWAGKWTHTHTVVLFLSLGRFLLVLLGAEEREIILLAPLLRELTSLQSSPLLSITVLGHPLGFHTLMTLDWPSEIVDVLFLCLEAMQIWTGRNHLWLNPIKIKGLWLFGLSDLEIFHLWLGGIAILHLRVCNLAVFLGSRLLLEEQVVALARKTFAQLHLVHQFCPFLHWEALQIVTDALVTPRPNYCSMFYTVLPLKTLRIFSWSRMQQCRQWWSRLGMPM